MATTYASTAIVLKDGLQGMTMPVRLVKTGADITSLFHETCGKCKGDIGRSKICKKGCKITNDDIIKAIHIGEGEKNIFAQDEIAGLKEVQKNLVVKGTIPVGQILRVRSMESYYVLPIQTKVGKKKIIDNDSLEMYKILFAGLEKTQMAIVVKDANRGKEHLSALIVEGGKVILVRLYFEENFRPLDEDGDFEMKITKEMTKMGSDFITKKLKKISLSEIEIDFNKKLEELIESGKGETVKIEQEAPEITVKASKKKVNAFFS